MSETVLALLETAGMPLTIRDVENVSLELVAADGEVVVNSSVDLS